MRNRFQEVEAPTYQPSGSETSALRFIPAFVQKVSLALMIVLSVFILQSCRHVKSCNNALTKTESFSYPIQDVEEALHTQGLYKHYHSVVDRPNLNFPGYLIGMEKSKKEIICVNDSDKIRENPFDNKQENSFLKDRLDDLKRVFVSHVIHYKKTVPDDKCAVITDNKLCMSAEYDLYKDIREGKKNADSAYNGSWTAISDLRKNFANGEKITHVFLYSVGWNTNENEAIENYNDMFSKVLKLSDSLPKEQFNPYFIGISWPSKWTTDERSFWEKLRKDFSYGNKANDADEVGFVLVNHLLRNVLIPLKESKKFKLILVGHSFGARLLTRAVFSSPILYKVPPPTKKDDIDLFIGLQGAFSLKRFIEDDGIEGSPYRDYQKHAKKFIFTWAKEDKATKSAFWTAFAGAESGYEYSLKHQEFEQAKWNENADVFANTSQGSDKVLIVDASEIISDHNDVYKEKVAKLVWNAVQKFAMK